MKVAIAVDGTQVAAHFGRCEGYILVDVSDGQIGPCERIDNPGHEPGKLPRMLHELDVECIVAGGMGPRAVGLFQQLGIEPIAGVSGSADAAMALLAKGELEGGDSTCHH